MFENILNSISNFFYQFSNGEIISLTFSLITLIIALAALITALALFRRGRRNNDVKRILTILYSLDLVYYSLEKHVRAWKSAPSDGQSSEAQRFWHYTDLTDLVTRLQEVKTLSKIHLKKDIHQEMTVFLEFLGDLILISYRGEDNSGKNYKSNPLISSDDFDGRLNLLITGVSKGLRMKNKTDENKVVISDMVKSQFLS